jgi:hypothetical protein
MKAVKLKLTENTANYPILRLVSAGGKWEMGIAPAYCGVIVGCTHHADGKTYGVNTYFYNFFHCQSSGLRLMEATAAVAAILSTLPENASGDNVLEVFSSCKNHPLACEEERIAALRIAASELRSPIVPIDDPDDEFLVRLKEICDNVKLARQKGFAISAFLSRKAYLNMPLPSSLEKQ